MSNARRTMATGPRSRHRESGGGAMVREAGWLARSRATGGDGERAVPARGGRE